MTALHTDRDPPAFAPPAAADADALRTGVVMGSRVSGNRDQARRVALEFVEAVRNGDAERMHQMLQEQLASPLVNGFRRTRPRLILIEQIVRARRRNTSPRAEVPRVLDLERIDIRPLQPDGQGFGSVVRPTDLMVTIPQTVEGRREVPQWYPQWRGAVRIVVRPGARAAVVGL